MLTPGSREGSPTLLVVELEGAADVAATAAALDWRPVFVRTPAYRAWLPSPPPGWAAPVVDVADPSFLDLFLLARKHGARAVLPLSLLEPECARDALLRDYAEREAPGLRVVANRPAAVELTYDKWLTKVALEEAGLPVIPGRAVGTVRELREAVEALGLPVVCKPRRAYTGRGVRVLATPEDVEGYVRRHAPTQLLVEPFLAGSELSVEVVRGPAGCLTQPVVYKGETRAHVVEHPAYRPRVAPWRPGAPEAAQAVQLAVAVATELRLQGALECEFVFVDGAMHLLEVNPRVSGVSRLGGAASGVSTFAALTRIAAGLPPAVPGARATGGVALQLPIVADVTAPAVEALVHDGVVRYAKPITWMPQLALRGSLLVAAPDAAALGRTLEAVAPLTNAAYLRDAETALAHARRPVPTPVAAGLPRSAGPTVGAGAALAGSVVA